MHPTLRPIQILSVPEGALDDLGLGCRVYFAMVTAHLPDPWTVYSDSSSIAHPQMHHRTECVVWLDQITGCWSPRERRVVLVTPSHVQPPNSLEQSAWLCPSEESELTRFWQDFTCAALDALARHAACDPLRPAWPPVSPDDPGNPYALSVFERIQRVRLQFERAFLDAGPPAASPAPPPRRRPAIPAVVDLQAADTDSLSPTSADLKPGTAFPGRPGDIVSLHMADGTVVARTVLAVSGPPGHPSVVLFDPAALNPGTAAGGEIFPPGPT